MLSPGIASRGRCPRTPSPRCPPRPDQPLDRVRFGDHVHLGASACIIRRVAKLQRASMTHTIR
jgi:hypothetical protein